MPPKDLPSQARLRELFDYDPDGHFVRCVGVNRKAFAGQPVHGAIVNGCLYASVDGQKYLLHRLVFMYHHGYCPPKVDHFPDRTRTNDRIENLRDATPSEQALNAKVRSDNTTGITGIYRDYERGKFYARPMREGVRTHLGYFDTIDEAALILEAWDA